MSAPAGSAGEKGRSVALRPFSHSRTTGCLPEQGCCASIPQNGGMSERCEATRHMDLTCEQVMNVLRDPLGHVQIDATGMLQAAEGDTVQSAGDTFVVHMDREALGDLPMGRYDVTVEITEYEPDARIAWTIHGTIKPSIGHVYGYELAAGDDGGCRVTSFYDWSTVSDEWRRRGIFPVVSPQALRATLGILERTARWRAEQA